MSSTPLEMENDLFASININRSRVGLKYDDIIADELTPQQLNTVNMTNMDIYNNSTDILAQCEIQNNLTNKNSNKIDQMLKATTESTETIHQLSEQLDILNKELNVKTTQYNELKSCLLKQTDFCENLSELLKKSEQKNTDLNKTLSKNNETIENLNNNLGNKFSKYLLCIIY